jgi:hypothetical protein
MPMRSNDMAETRTKLAELDPVSIEDADQNGLDELVVKFDREAFQDILEVGELVETRISGMATNHSFAGRDTIRTIRRLPSTSCMPTTIISNGSRRRVPTLRSITTSRLICICWRSIMTEVTPLSEYL